MNVLILICPLIGAIASGFFGRWLGGKGSAIITIFNLFISWCLILCANYYYIINEIVLYYTIHEWIQIMSIHSSIGLFLGNLSFIMLTLVLTISLMVHLYYSYRYMNLDPHLPRFLSYLSLFTFFMLLLVSSNNFIQFFMGLEGGILCVLFYFNTKKTNTHFFLQVCYILNTKVFTYNRFVLLFLFLIMFTCIPKVEASGLFDLSHYIDISKKANPHLQTVLPTTSVHGIYSQPMYPVGHYLYSTSGIRYTNSFFCLDHQWKFMRIPEYQLIIQEFKHDLSVLEKVIYYPKYLIIGEYHELTNLVCIKGRHRPDLFQAYDHVHIITGFEEHQNLSFKQAKWQEVFQNGMELAQGKGFISSGPQQLAVVVSVPAEGLSTLEINSLADLWYADLKIVKCDKIPIQKCDLIVSYKRLMSEYNGSYSRYHFHRLITSREYMIDDAFRCLQLEDVLTLDHPLRVVDSYCFPSHIKEGLYRVYYDNHPLACFIFECKSYIPPIVN